MELSSQQLKYIAEWHDAFMDYVGRIISLADTMKMLENATDSDKHNLDLFKTILNCKDVYDVERDLSSSKVKNSTIDKIAKLDKDIVDFAVDHMSVSPLIQQFLKQVSYYHIEYNKQATKKQIKDLNIPFSEE